MTFCGRLLGLLLVTLVAVQFGGAKPIPADTPVVFGTVGGFSERFQPLFAAQQLGYFAAEGITVQTIDFGGSATLLPQVAAKRVTVGFPNPEPIILSHNPGKEPLPVTFFYNVIRRDVWEISVLASSDIHTLQDLKGKKIGIFGFNSGNIPITKAILLDAGLHDGDYELVPVGLGASANLALQTGKIDALNLFDVVDDQLNALGTKVRILPEPKKYTGLYSNGFVANNDVIKNDPSVLVKFARAITKGEVACDANPKGCIRLMFQLHPNTKPKNLEGDAALQFSEETNKRRAAAMSAPRGHYGEFDPQVWRNFIAALAAGGELKTTNIPIDELFTNKFVKEINNFDYQQVVKDAQKLP